MYACVFACLFPCLSLWRHRFLDDALGVNKYYRKHGIQFGTNEIDPATGQPVTLLQMVDRLAKAPLVFQPGESWRYSHATDVLGGLVEVCVWGGGGGVKVRTSGCVYVCMYVGMLMCVRLCVRVYVCV